MPIYGPMYGSAPVYHFFETATSGEGPFAFNVVCMGCDADELSHLKDCPRVVGWGILLHSNQKATVHISYKGGITEYDSLMDAGEDLIDQPVQFRWGPNNPEADKIAY